MKDLIDLGNLVFNQLTAKHGEIEESRMLFLYGITQKTKWEILNSKHYIIIEAAGIIKNFVDPVIDDLNKQWIALKANVDYSRLEGALKRMRSEFDRPAPKDGDIWEWGSKSEPFREITI